MSTALVAKPNKPARPETEPDAPDLSELPQLPPEPDPKSVTTWKCFQTTAKTLRLIGAHLNMKQEAVLALFDRYYEDYLLTLQAKDVADRKKRKGE